MTKGENGVWTVTIGPLEPDQYSYNFSVDGARMVDPSNTKFKIGRGSYSNLVEIPDRLESVCSGSHLKR